MQYFLVSRAVRHGKELFDGDIERVIANQSAFHQQVAVHGDGGEEAGGHAGFNSAQMMQLRAAPWRKIQDANSGSVLIFLDGGEGENVERPSWLF